MSSKMIKKSNKSMGLLTKRCRKTAIFPATST
eukprot:CAMPEP_0117561276 /NCGR_PEP_ID=MMETSP0784-20121206/54327_1 /TAXON_ID=39447 /ORGANISM="" /LENGTH=31 /DNA_ID= /DNA_START= /DNA_END= /DNA_ORIENTATION=